MDPALLFRMTRGQQRPYASIPRIDWTHPLSRGLLFFHYDTGTLQKAELVSNLSLSQHNAGTPIKPAGSKFGTTFLGDASASNGVQYSSSAALQALVPPFFFACGWMRTATTTEGGAGFAGRGANNIGSAPFYNYAFEDNQDNTGSTRVGCVANNGGTLANLSTTANIVLASNVYHATLGYLQSVSQWAWWADGAEVGTGSGANSYANVNSGDPVVFYTDFGGPNGFQGNIYWFGVWKSSAAIAAADITQIAKALYLDPYQFLIYPEDEMIVDRVGVAATQPVILRDWPVPQSPPRIDFAPAQQRSQALLSGPQLKPFFQSDWQSWQRPPVIDFAPVQQRSQALLSGPQLKPFFQSDWPSPFPIPKIDFVAVQQRSQALVTGPQLQPFFQSDWPSPFPIPRIDFAPAQQRSQALLSGPQLQPFFQSDWPKPFDPPKIDFATQQQRSQALLSGPQLKPFFQSDWPAPAPPPRMVPVLEPQMFAGLRIVVTVPAANFDWPVPMPPPRIDFAPVQQRSQALLSGPQLLPVQNYDWPTPAPPPWRPQTIEQQFLPQLKIVVSLPPQNYDFPRPQPPPDIASSMLYINLALAGPGAPNVVQQDWPVPLQPPPVPQAFNPPYFPGLQTPPAPVPFAYGDWPAPLPPPRIDFAPVQQRSQALITGPQLQPPPTQNDFTPPAPPYVINFVGMQPYNLALATFTPPVVTDIHYLPFFSTPGKLKAF